MSVGKNASIYLLSNIINQSIPFLLLPVLTRYLAPDEYGLIATFGALVGILGILIGLNGHGAVGRYYFDLPSQELAVFTGTTFFILIISFVIVGAVVFLFKGLIGSFTGLPENWHLLAPVVALANYITLTNLTLWQSEKKAAHYGSYLITKSLLNAGLTAVLVIVFSIRMEGPYLESVRNGRMFCPSQPMDTPKTRVFVLADGIRGMPRSLLRYSLPLVPHSLAGWIQVSLDRIIIVSLVSLEAAGIYAVAATLSKAVAFVVDSFAKAWTPHVLRNS